MRRMNWLVSRAVLVGALLAAIECPAAFAQVADPGTACVNGYVYAMQYANGRLWIAGDFTYVGPPTGGAVPINRATGQVVPGFPRVNGQVDCILDDGAGGWIIGGLFTKVGSAARTNLARIHGDFTVDAFAPLVDGHVRELARSGDALYVGGEFDLLGGQPRYRLGAVSLTTGLATGWNPNPAGNVDGAGIPSHITAIETVAGSVYVGGDFTSIGGAPRRCLAKLDATTGAATTWAPNPDYVVFDIAASGGVLYAVGGFLSIAGSGRACGAAFDLATGSLLAWNAQADNDVHAVVASGSTVWIAGAFTHAGGASRLRVAALDAVTGAATGWNPGASWSCSSLGLTNGVVYVGGAFTGTGDGSVRHNIFAADSATGAVTPWAPVVGGGAYTIAASSSIIYVGGTIANVGGRYSPGLAAIDPATGQVASDWNLHDGPGYHVSALTVLGGTAYVGGNFNYCGTFFRRHLAAYDSQTGALLTSNVGLDSDVNVLAESAGAIFAGGSSVSALVAFDPMTGATLPWSAALQPLHPGGYQDPSVLALTRDGATLYVAGQFSGAGGAPRSLLAALDVSTGLATPWNPGSDDFVRSIAVADGKAYLGGDFLHVGGAPRSYVAAVDAATGNLLGWAPNADAAVQAILPVGGTIYAGGDFTSIGGATRTRLAALDRVTGAAHAWNIAADGRVSALAWGGGRLWVGGSFQLVGGDFAPGLSSIAPDLTDVTPEAAVDEVRTWPNPFVRDVSIEFSLARAGRVQLEALDLSGRRIWVSAAQPLEPGRHALTWNGRTSSGRRTSAGVYFLRAHGPGFVTTRRVVHTN